jgi:hypothetical protein
MLTLWFERRHNVLLARVTSMLSSEDIETHDRSVLRFLAGRTDVRAIYDFSGVDTLAIPASKIAQRGQRPAMITGRRVVVASRQAGADFAHIIRDQQSAAGLPEPLIVATLEEAYAQLGLDRAADFEPVEVG